MSLLVQVCVLRVCVHAVVYRVRRVTGTSAVIPLWLCALSVVATVPLFAGSPSCPGVGVGADVPIDLSELPHPLAKFEAMFQLCNTDGSFHVIRHDLNQTFSLHWDAEVLPSAVVHISNFGRG